MERQSAGPASFLGVRKEDAGLLVRIYFLFFVSGMMSTVLGVILPFLGDEHGLSQTVRGALLSAHQIGNLAALFISGILPYAIGRKQNTVLLGSGIVIGLALITLTGNPLILFCAFALTGIGRGTMSNITNVVVGESMANKGAGLNLLHATFAVGAFIAPFMVIALSSSGWRAEPLVIAALMALALVLVVFSSLSSGRSGKDRRKEEFPCSFTFWVNTFIMFFYLCGEASLMGWLVTYFASLDAGAGFSTAMQSLLWIMILAGRLVCAAISARVDKPRLILILGIMMLASFLLLIAAPSMALKVIGVIGTGLAMSGIYPTTLSTMDRNYNNSTVATGICIGTATVGAIVMPVIIGSVADAAGVATGFSLIAVPIVVMVVLQVVKAARR